MSVVLLICSRPVPSGLATYNVSGIGAVPSGPVEKAMRSPSMDQSKSTTSSPFSEVEIAVLLAPFALLMYKSAKVTVVWSATYATLLPLGAHANRTSFAHLFRRN